jgi:hypothetical protein
MFKRRATFERKASKIAARVAKIPTSELPIWADQAINDTGRSLTAWRRRGDRVDLEEAILGAEALSEILRSVRDRT